MKVDRILIFSFSFIGDTVLSTAVIEPLKRRFPDAKISILMGPRAENLLQGDFRINELIIYDRKGTHAGLKGRMKLIRELNDREFDLIINLRDSFWTHLVRGRSWGIQMLKRPTREYKKSHAVVRYLDVLHAHDVDISEASPKICLLPAEEIFADDFLKRNGVKAGEQVIGIHPGGVWVYKLWPVERFSALGDLLSQKYRAKILVFSGSEEAPLQDKMAKLMKFPPIVVKDVGLRELAALMQRCHVYIGNDTGPMHLAAAMGTPVVAIFGPTDYDRSGPYGSKNIVISESIECNPCHPGRRPAGWCNLGYCKAMQAISVEKVAEGVERILRDES